MPAIVYGKKRVERQLGYVADFCPICREISTFRFARVGMADHVYYLSVGQGELVGYMATCQTCGLALGQDKSRYAKVSAYPIDLPALVEETFPSIREAFSARLELEEKLRRDPTAIEPGVRKALIREPFAVLAPLVQQRASEQGRLDTRSGLGCLFAFLIPFLIFFIPALGHRHHSPSPVALYAAGTVFAVMLVYTFYALMTSWRRFGTAYALPKLAKALSPLSPSAEELSECLEELKTSRQPLAKVITVTDLLVEVNAFSYPLSPH